MKFVEFTKVVVNENEDGIEEEREVKVAVNAAEVRSFSPRKGERIGTRLVFNTGVGLPVKELYEEVLARMNGTATEYSRAL